MRFRPLRPAAASAAVGELIPDPPQRMKAVAIDTTGPPAVLRLTDAAVPAPIMSEMLVRIVAAGINPIDAKTRDGRGVSAAIPSFPAILGFDFSGVVVRSPFEAHPLTPGTPVFGMIPVPRYSGSYAEFATVPAMSIARKPASLSHVEAAGVPLAALTAWGLVVETAHAHEGQRMLIHAASGGVGHFAVQFAAYFGAHVTVTASERNAGWLRDLGAAVVIDYATTRFEDVVGDMDVVIDLVGNTADSTGSRSLGVLRPGGLLINVPTASWPTYAEEAGEAGMRATSYKVSPDGVALATIARLLDSGAVQVYVDKVFDLKDAAAAHAELERGHTRGKIVLRVSDD